MCSVKITANFYKLFKNPERLLDSSRKQDNILSKLVDDLVFYISRTGDPGAILIFLSGFKEIQSVIRKLKSNSRYPKSKTLIICSSTVSLTVRFFTDKFAIYKLYSLMPTDQQQKIFTRPPDGVRKIIVATNIAEISLTIDDVVYVIDGGKMKVKKFDVRKNILTLKEEWITLANVTQRKGRAGRYKNKIDCNVNFRSTIYTC